MPFQDPQRSPTKFYQEDIVKKISPPQLFGVVLRCWHDADDATLPTSPMDPLMRPLKRGEVGVNFFPSGERAILSETDFELVDRTFRRGDFCKRRVEDVQSGVITKVDTQVRVAHAISGESVEGWRTKEEFHLADQAEIADYVVHDDWIGQVMELFDEVVVEISTGQLVRLPEICSHLTVGDKGRDILPPSPRVMQNLFGFLTTPESVDTVIAVKHTVLAVCWLAINQSLDPIEAQTRKRPQRFWSGTDMSKLTLIRSDPSISVGDKLRFKDPTGLPFTTHGDSTIPFGLLENRFFVVRETRTSVEVLWQDGTTETLKSTDIIPYMNPDEYDCWPGDHVISKVEDETRPVIVQSVNATQRTARILYPDSGKTDLASLLELDPYGTSDPSTASPSSSSEGLGVRRGDHVFVHNLGTTNGFEKARVPRIGEIEPWVQDPPIDNEGRPAGWRKEMYDIGNDIATSRPKPTVPMTGTCIKRLDPGNNEITWFGEVTGLNLDGTVEITHPDLSTKSVLPLERLTKLYDAVEQLEDGIWEDDHDHGSDDDEMDEDDLLDSLIEWEDDNDDDDDSMDVDLPLSWADTPIETVPPPAPSESRSDTPQAESTDVMVASTSSIPEVADNAEDEDTPWKRFDILSSAPPDHAFYSSPPAQPSKSFLGRLTREYRVLASSLPESILVRAYEDRTDLLRSLIIGPENTPYQDAPFVIDWMLDSNYPNSPPIAHFWSWTNGNGRVNPNLYEEGKVCLSILGTWAGDRNETWNAGRSSLLQAFISIQGLVLVKEPWFCEPAYEKLRGTEDGMVNSRLYSEKAFVLSRGFVRRALEIPLGGLESEISWLYYTTGRLAKVINDSRMLIETSKATSDNAVIDEDLAVPRLTAGGIISLERTLTRLQRLLDVHSST